MPRIVIDANVTLAWLLNEALGTKVKAVLDESDLVAPWLWRVEVANTLLVRERRKTLPAAEAKRLANLIDEIPIAIIAEPDDRSAAALAAFARPHQLTTYDALYLDLAVRLGLPLFTLDRNLSLAAGRVGVELIRT